MNRENRMGLNEYLSDNLMALNLIIIGIGEELLSLEPKFKKICETSDQGKYISVHEASNARRAIQNAFQEVSELMAQINVEDFIDE